MKKLKIISLILVALPLLVVLVNAGLYSTLQNLEGMNCNFVERNSLDFSIRTDLINKFGLTGGGDCSFVVDSLAFHLGTQDLVWYMDFWYADPWYSEINYVVDGNHEYIFILGKDYVALNNLANFTANYDKFESVLSNPVDIFYLEEDFWDWYDPNNDELSDWPFINCVDNPNANIYTGNSANYYDELEADSFTLETSCYEEDMLMYNYCSQGLLNFHPITCNCVEGKCISNSFEVFFWIENYDFYVNPGTAPWEEDIFYWYFPYGTFPSFQSTLVDDEIVSSSIRSWINN